MSAGGIVAAALVGYVVFVAFMELAIGVVQPDMETGVVLTTMDAVGETSSRMLAGFEFEDQLYVSSNHWLRGWYREALARPVVSVTVGDVETQRRAVSIVGDERDRVADAYQMGFVLRFVCGFAPSRFLRLDPVAEGS